MRTTIVIIAVLALWFAVMAAAVQWQKVHEDWAFFAPICASDGVVRGRNQATQPLSPHYLSEVASLAREAGHDTWQFGAFLLVTRDPVRAPSGQFADRPNLAPEDPWGLWRWPARGLLNEYWSIVVHALPAKRAKNENFSYEQAELAQRYRLFAAWWATDPPGRWRNRGHFYATCFATLKTLRPEWAQFPGSLMSRLLWQDRWRRLTAFVTGEDR